jgi:signal transduction histidine kinase
LDEEGQNLVLAAGAGEPGQIMKTIGHTIPLGREHSLVARAARTRQGVISNDVTQEPDFLPHPLLPETKSELALPLIVGDRVIGVLDVQASITGRFTGEDMRVKTALADQIAVAVENARAYQEQEQTAHRLREVDRLKSQFLANMSHELRTPLNSIIGYAEVLIDGIDGDLSAEAVEDVETIHSGGKHLLSIINDILDLAKIEAGQMRIDRRESNLMQVMQEVHNTCAILAENKGIELNIEPLNDIPAVAGDPVRMRQIILNLVNNAIKFTEQGEVRVELEYDQDRQVIVRVKDTGIGMTSDEMNGLFQQFHQVDGSMVRRPAAPAEPAWGWSSPAT